MNTAKKEKKDKKKDPPISPKGMRDIIGDEYYKFQGFIERASEVAVYYDFKPIETPILEQEEVFTSGVGANTDIVEKEMYSLKTKGGDHFVLRPEGTAAVMRSYLEHGMHTSPQPVQFYYSGPFFRHERPQRGRYREFYQFGLEIMGTQKSISDAIIIRVATLILQEAGITNVTVLINSIGDRESRPEYIKALTIYYKKHMSEICSDCKQRLKTNPMRLLDCKKPECQKIKADAPETINYLSSEGKQHFKEVLEYLDHMEIPYRIDTTLVRGIDYYSHTVFEIIIEEPELIDLPPPRPEIPEFDPETGEPTVIPPIPLLAGGIPAPVAVVAPAPPPPPQEKAAPLSICSGGRYDYLARQLGSKKDVPGIGCAIGIDRVLELKNYVPLTPRILKKPKVYFIQLGFEAKLKSLAIIETLRKSKIPTALALNKDKLSVQLGMAERQKIPYVLILGQKEALEGTVIVRNMATRSQDTIKIDTLSDYIKKNM